MSKEDLSQIIQRIERLEKVVFGKVGSKLKQEGNTDTPIEINFSLNERAFVKRYAAGKSGPEKFTIMVAYLAKGKVGENVKLSDIKEHWNKMKTKSLLGKFNMFYSNEAKIHGWVDTESRGIYKLTNEWRDAL